MARLLVSVRSLAEARAALDGGCDVLDLKEPLRGPLGMVEPATIAAVGEFVRAFDPGVALSVALGEAIDWTSSRAVPTIPAEISYFKLGTAGLGVAGRWPGPLALAVRQFKDSFGGKRRETASVRQGVCASAGLENHVNGVQSARRTLAVSHPPIPVAIAVAYADFERAKAPVPEDVLGQAAQSGCGGVLIDTCCKENGRLTDWCDTERLGRLAAQARRSGLSLGLAGSLQIDDLPEVCALDPEIVGIRSAACRGGLRRAEIDPAAVRAFREALASREIMAAN